jgi:hypothetical protein
VTAGTLSLDVLTGWRYPRTQPSLPESNATVQVPRAGPLWRKALAFAGRLLSVVAWSVAVVIIGLNGWLLIQTGVEWL